MDNQYTKDMKELADYIVHSNLKEFYLGQIFYNFLDQSLDKMDQHAKRCAADIMELDNRVSQYAMIFDLFRALEHFANLVDIQNEEYSLASLGVYDIINELCHKNYDIYAFLRILTDSVEYLIQNNENQVDILAILQPYLFCVTQIESAIDDYLAYYNMGGAEVEDDGNVLQVHNLITQDFLGRMYFDYVKKEDHQDDHVLYEELLVMPEKSFIVLKETYDDKMTYFEKVFLLNDIYEKERSRAMDETSTILEDYHARKEMASLISSVQTMILYMDEMRVKYLHDKIDALLHKRKFVTLSQYVKDNIKLSYNMMPYYSDYIEKEKSNLIADLLFSWELDNEENQMNEMSNEEWDLMMSDLSEVM